jgi:hypothetical protein
MIGSVAKCGNGVLGIITYTKNNYGVVIYHGISFDGKPWHSKMPRVVAKSINEYFGNK